MSDGTADMRTWMGARLDERERVAHAASGNSPHWVAGQTGYGCGAVEPGDGDAVFPIVYDEGCPTEDEAAHIASHDPAWVLADVEAKRRILDMWEDPAQVEHLPEGVVDGRDPDERAEQVAVAQAIDRVVRILAAVHADRPGYREEWRPGYLADLDEP